MVPRKRHDSSHVYGGGREERGERIWERSGQGDVVTASNQKAYITKLNDDPEVYELNSVKFGIRICAVCTNAKRIHFSYATSTLQENTNFNKGDHSYEHLDSKTEEPKKELHDLTLELREAGCRALDEQAFLRLAWVKGGDFHGIEAVGLAASKEKLERAAHLALAIAVEHTKQRDLLKSASTRTKRKTIPRHATLPGTPTASKRFRTAPPTLGADESGQLSGKYKEVPAPGPGNDGKTVLQKVKNH